MNTNKMNYNDGYLMAIDLGTSTLKVALFSLNGDIVSFRSHEYPLIYPGKDMIENDVEDYWNSLVELIKDTLIKSNCDPLKILAVAISSQGETIVPVDKHIKPLRPAIVWLDRRSAVEAEKISIEFENDDLFSITGQPASDPSWPASRIMWIKNKEPDIFEKTYKFLLLKDYIAFKLTGNIFGESTLYNSTYYYDINRLEYYQPMLDYLGINQNRLPPIVYSGTVMGNISNEASHMTGLSVTTKFVSGAMDQVAGAVGAGNISQGIVTETTGSAFAMIVTTDGPIIDRTGKLPCQLHAINGKYCLMPYSNTGGMVLKWFKDNFFDHEHIKKPKNAGIYDLMTSEASEVPAGSEGLIMLPHISGAFFPENNPRAKGVFFGININHTRAHFVRAILESIGYMLRKDLEIFQKNRIKINNLISMGGGAKSSLWNQIKADITGFETNIPENTETALLGAAIIAGVGTGIYKDFNTAVKSLVRMKKKYTPDNTIKDVYNSSYKKYIELYDNLESLF